MDSLLITIYLMNLFDLFTTRLFIGLNLAEEINPFMNMILDTAYMEVYKILLYPIFLFILKWVYDRYPEHKRKVYYVTSSLFAMYFALVCYELYGYYIYF